MSGYTLGSSSSAAPVPTYTGGNRAEKYLPSLPIIQRGEMGKGRVKEVGEWYRFLEVFVSWLALIDEAYVSEMRHCLKHPNVIEQAKLQSPVAAFTTWANAWLSGSEDSNWSRACDRMARLVGCCNSWSDEELLAAIYRLNRGRRARGLRPKVVTELYQPLEGPTTIFRSHEPKRAPGKET